MSALGYKANFVKSAIFNVNYRAKLQMLFTTQVVIVLL